MPYLSVTRRLHQFCYFFVELSLDYPVYSLVSLLLAQV